MRIRIKALDTLFFRDGKPFGMDESTWATGIFPPPPSVFYGALRSLYFSLNPDKMRLAGTKNDPTVKGNDNYLIINRLLLETESPENTRNLAFDSPADFVIENKGKSNESKYLLKTLDNQSITSAANQPFSLRLGLDRKPNGNYPNVDKLNDGLILEDDFANYLDSSLPSYRNLSEFITNDPKVGIGRSNITKTTEDGKLYRVGMTRLVGEKANRLNFIIEFDGFEIPASGFIKLGGEGKGCYYEECNEDIDFEQVNIDKIFKIYFATPAIFEKGWIPTWIDNTTMEGIIPNTTSKIKLLTASVGKPNHIGGFDMKKGQPKPMLKAIPQGSVYYFELLEGNKNDVFDFFHQKNVSDTRACEGFGLAYVGLPNI